MVLPNITVADLCNELIDYPTWIGYHFYFMRVCNKNGVNIVYDDINYAVVSFNVVVIIPTSLDKENSITVSHL